LNKKSKSCKIKTLAKFISALDNITFEANQYNIAGFMPYENHFWSGYYCSWGKSIKAHENLL